MIFIKCHLAEPSEKICFINMAMVAEMFPTDYGCAISYITSNGDGDQVYRKVTESVGDILDQIAKYQK